MLIPSIELVRAGLRRHFRLILTLNRPRRQAAMASRSAGIVASRSADRPISRHAGGPAPLSEAVRGIRCKSSITTAGRQLRLLSSTAMVDLGMRQQGFFSPWGRNAMDCRMTN